MHILFSKLFPEHLGCCRRQTRGQTLRHARVHSFQNIRIGRSRFGWYIYAVVRMTNQNQAIRKSVLFNMFDKIWSPSLTTAIIHTTLIFIDTTFRFFSNPMSLCRVRNKLTNQFIAPFGDLFTDWIILKKAYVWNLDHFAWGWAENFSEAGQDGWASPGDFKHCSGREWI